MKWSLILFLLTSCVADNEREFVEQHQDIKLEAPLTAKQGQKIIKEAKKSWYKKTMGKYLPDVNIVSLKGDSIELNSIIDKYTMISFTDIHCGWGSGYIQDIFPEVYECNYYNDQIKFALLINVDSLEYINSEEAKEDMEFQLYWYRNKDDVYFIERNQAKRLNFFSIPTHIITNAEGKVIHYETGAHLVDHWLPIIDSITHYTGSH